MSHLNNLFAQLNFFIVIRRDVFKRSYKSRKSLSPFDGLGYLVTSSKACHGLTILQKLRCRSALDSTYSENFGEIPAITAGWSLLLVTLMKMSCATLAFLDIFGDFQKICFQTIPGVTSFCFAYHIFSIWLQKFTIISN